MTKNERSEDRNEVSLVQAYIVVAVINMQVTCGQTTNRLKYNEKTISSEYNNLVTISITTYSISMFTNTNQILCMVNRALHPPIIRADTTYRVIQIDEKTSFPKTKWCSIPVRRVAASSA